jgi:phosphoserine phosphatase
VAGAAFFDLDRTLIRRSSVLALAGTFRRRGLISRLALVKSALWQVLFVLRGASAERVRSAAEDGMKILNGFSVEEMQHLVGDAMETVLRPLVYEEPLQLVARHRANGERVYIVSATL